MARKQSGSHAMVRSQHAHICSHFTQPQQWAASALIAHCCPPPPFHFHRLYCFGFGLGSASKTSFMSAAFNSTL